MAFDRCLLIACVTLSQACDSKRTAPVEEQPAPADAAPSIVVAPDESMDELFEALRAAAPAEDFVLAIGGARYPVRYTARAIGDGPGMVATLHGNGDVALWSATGAEGTAARPKLVTPLDEAGENTIRAVLADIVTRTGAKRIDLVVDRIQPGRALAALIEAVRPPFEHVRVAAGVPSTPTQMTVKVPDAGPLQMVIANDEQSLRHCFEESLRRDGPIAALRLEVQGAISVHGQLRDVTTRGAHSAHLATCVTQAVRGWDLEDVTPGPFSFHIDMQAK